MPYQRIAIAAAVVADYFCKRREHADGLLRFVIEGQRNILQLGSVMTEQGVDSFGAARRAKDSNGCLFVVRSRDMGRGARSKTLPEELERMQRLSHPNLVRLVGYTLQQPRLHLCLELVAFGPLPALIAETGPLDGRLLLRAIEDILIGLSYLHSCQPPIVHGDVRGANILVDFGLTMKLTNIGLHELGAAPPIPAGALEWSAPEVAQGCLTVDRKKADVWSMGCTMIEICSGRSPFGRAATEGVDCLAPASTAAEQSSLCSSPAIPPMPLGLQGLTQRCLRRPPAQRPSATELAAYFHRFALGVKEA